MTQAVEQKMMVTEQQMNHFRTFGFVIFRQLFTPAELATYKEEFDRGLNLWIEGGVHTGEKRHYALFTHGETPFICSLHDDPRFADAAEQLLNKPVLGVTVNGNYYVGDTQWHPDNGTQLYEGVKFAIYLEPRDAKTGALRVIPGSHRDPLYSAMKKDPQAAFGVRPDEVPCFPFESQPGDVLAFNLATWHSAFGGDDHRRMGVVLYYEDPQTPEVEAMMVEHIKRAINTARNYGQPGWFTPYWKSIDNPRHQRWVRRLTEMGVIDV